MRSVWWVVAGGWLCLVLLWGSAVPPTGLFFGPVSEAFRTTRAQVSLLASFAAAGTCVGSLVSGWLLGLFDARRVMVAGAVLMGAGYLLAGRAASFQILLLCYALIGAGAGIGTLIPVSFIVGNWFEGRRIGLAMGLVMTGPSLGGSAMVMVVNFLITRFGWRSAYLAMALPVFVIVIPVALLLRSHPPRSAEAGRAAASELAGLEVAQAVGTREFWLIALSQLSFGCVAAAVLAHLVPYLEGVGYSVERAAVALSVALGLTSIGKITMGLAADRIGSRWAVALDFLLEAAGVAMLIGAARVAFLIPGVACYGLSWGTPLALLPMLTIESLGLKHYGAIAGLTSVAFAVGNALGPYLTGKAFDLTGGYTDALIVMAVLMAITAGAAAACRPLGAVEAAGGAQAQPALP